MKRSRTDLASTSTTRPRQRTTMSSSAITQRRATTTLFQPLQAFVGRPLPLGFLRCRRRRHAPCQRGFDLAALVVIDVDREPFIRRFPEVATSLNIERLGNKAADGGNVPMPPFALDVDALDQDRAEAGGLPPI